MQLLLTPQVIKRLLRELRHAGDREIGGLLLGEHVQDDVFRLVGITVQRTGGSSASFVRNPSDHHRDLEAFFARTGGDYTRFNYLGEWHSHPGMAPIPSNTDMRAMQSIAEDPSVGANFVVLLIVSLSGRDNVSASALAFRPQAQPVPVVMADASFNGVKWFSCDLFY